ncbi:LOW QUALITY PROTEIN: probable metal-nicotianamine transporter YSL12 [Phragmites australis]|uniref:LOW QUALITY PROTEIN: probable metal-nicotianamine transporter YSL12 n=1 Tax=Phragmites australis TaxID=29695 RepID=UPI002D795998|nr:LOW QUALITY PROTEIN: probable metal-nicotianamine transporter YSL12 [Phragmites australis]
MVRVRGWVGAASLRGDVVVGLRHPIMGPDVAADRDKKGSCYLVIATGGDFHRLQDTGLLDVIDDDESEDADGSVSWYHETVKELPEKVKVGIFVFGAWAGASHGGVITGLAVCGVMMTIVAIAADLIQDFKTGYMTLASPRFMFVRQVIGTAMGCVIGPCVFWLFYRAFGDVGMSTSDYPAPCAMVYRNMAIFGVSGSSSLPKHCFTMCYVMFAAASVAINLVRDLVQNKVSRFIPDPMAIPFYLGSYFAIGMCVGSATLFAWEKMNKAEADAISRSVASGLICGEGIWSMPQSVLALAKVQPPICMKFLSRSMNARMDAFMENLSSKTHCSFPFLPLALNLVFGFGDHGH